MNYYNEFDKRAAAWLRELIKQKHIPEGEVDERSITDITTSDLAGFCQCHFFAGIGGWPLALRLAGWPEDRPVWTGSCPCQPFSSAGRQLAEKDERHLWPVFGNLIRQCGPATVFGEQVASKLGREWLSRVFVDLEGMGYAVAGSDLCAASVGAPHIRQRLYWMGNPDGSRFSKQCWAVAVSPKLASAQLRGNFSHYGNFDIVQCRDGKARRFEPGSFPLADGFPGRVGVLRGYGNAIVPPLAAEFIKASGLI